MKKFLRWFALLFGVSMFWNEVSGEIKALVFDCDGVLVDTEGLKFLAWQKVLQQRGIILTAERYQELIGQDSPSILSQIAEEHHLSLAHQIIEEKNNLYKSWQKQGVQSIDAVMQVLAWAKGEREQKKLQLGVATSAARNEVLFNLDYLKILPSFDVILSGKDDLTKYQRSYGNVNKPEPFIYIEICERMQISPQECLVLEDSEPGVIAAKRAGCKVIAVPNKWTAKQNFKDADLLLYPYDAEKIIQNIQYFLQQ